MSNKILLLIFLVLSLLPVYGENIVGSMTGLLILENGEDTSPVEIGLEDLASMDYLYDNPFVQGVELIFHQSSTARLYRNSFALYLYRDVQPEPEGTVSQYRGSQFFMQIIPYTTEFSVKIPFNSDHSLRKEADSVVTTPVSKEDFPLLLTMLPISKGLPTQAKEAVLSFSVRPLYAEQGGLKIFIEGEENLPEEEMDVRIDGTPMEWPRDYFSLQPGFHTVHIESQMGGSREFNIAIEAGRFTEIRYTLERAFPKLIFTPAPGVVYYLDDREITSEEWGVPMNCQPGNHRIGIKLNENLLLTEEYTLGAGEILTISLDARILIEKN
ncbi:MAG: hypothetical protein PQJ60_12570 [Spirochaetales bacterium]|nr:hypothetical protein [Spirochaetales bacterium]